MHELSPKPGISRRQALGTFAMTLVAASLAPRADALDASAALQSSALTLLLRPSPYHFEIVERSTGRVLLSHQATGVREGRRILKEQTWATRAHELQGDSQHLSGRLDVGGDDAKALGVSFELIAPEIVKVTLRALRPPVDPTHERFAITESFVDQGESIYGVFEAAWPRRLPTGLYSLERGLDNRGVTANLMGNRMHAWFDGMRYSSARAPFYMTSAGYGIYTQSPWTAQYRLAVDRRISFEFDDAELVYFVIYGPSYEDILRRYSELAGPARMPPDWALGPVWWRDDIHEDLRNPEGGRHANAQEVVLGDVHQLATRRIPASAMWLDRPYARSNRRFGWGGVENGRFEFDASFPDPKRMVDTARAAGIRLMVWIANRSDNEMGEEGERLGYLLSTRRAVDMRNPAARRWFQDKLDSFLDDGIQGYKIDRGEEGEVPAYLQNLNAILFPQMAAQGLTRRFADDYFVFARNLYDTGRRYAAVWNGDSYGWKGLRESVRQALRCALMNFPMWGSDTGGYGDTTPELFARWIEFAAYAPMMEILIGPGRTPWLDFPPAIVDIVVEQARTKHDLIPYLRSLVFRATTTGMPVMRPLFLAHPRDA